MMLAGLSAEKVGLSARFDRFSGQRPSGRAPTSLSRSTDPSISDGPAPRPATAEGTGSEPAYLAVAQVLAPHGVNGEIRCAVLTDFPERFRKTRLLHVGESYVPFQVESARLSKGGLLLKLREVESREDAAALRGQVLFVPVAEAMPLPKGSYYWHEIIGLEVRTADGRSLGTVAEILETGSNDVYVVRDGGHEILVPAITEVVRDVDIVRGVITVDLIEGLTW